MPRERIYGAFTPFGDEDVRRTVVDLSWSREAGHVQMATLSIDGVTGDPVEIGTVELPTPDGTATAPILGGMYLQLDRDGINRLIRNLRRARDQAFGRDE